MGVEGVEKAQLPILGATTSPLPRPPLPQIPHLEHRAVMNTPLVWPCADFHAHPRLFVLDLPVTCCPPSLPKQAGILLFYQWYSSCRWLIVWRTAWL